MEASSHAALTRSELLARCAAAGVGIASAGALAGPLAGAAQAAGASVPTLRRGATVKLFAWQGYDDKAALATLKRRYGVTVKTTYIAGDQEVFTKLGAARGSGQWDVLTYNSGLDRGLYDQGVLQALEPAEFPNARDIFPEFVDLAFIHTGSGNTVTGFPFSWGYQGFVRNKNLPPLHSWQELFSPKLKGRIVAVNDPTTSVASMALAAGFKRYDRLTPAQLDHVMGLWRKLRPSLRTIVSDYGAAKDLLVRGEVDGCVPGWQAMVVWAAQDGKRLYHDFPKEGVYGFLDLLCVLKGTKDPQTSMAFVNYMLSPQAQADLGKDLSQGITNRKAVALLPRSLRDVYQYAALPQNFRRSPIRRLPPAKAANGYVGFADWAVAWERFTAGS